MLHMIGLEISSTPLAFENVVDFLLANELPIFSALVGLPDLANF
jgi:hypothetical protein